MLFDFNLFYLLYTLLKPIILEYKQYIENLKKFREEKNLKQKNLFILLNIASSSYSVYETSKVLIPTIFLYKIAKTYNYSIDKLLGKK